MEAIGVRITGTGSYLPERVVTNKELETIVDTTDDWIRTRTGIEQRHFAADDEPTSALGAAAAERALDAAGMTPEEVELIIVATITPDKIFPNTACFVQQRIGAVNATCFSVEAACSGFLYILDIGAALIRSGIVRNALIIGAEKLSSIMNWDDRSTCVLFGDGAGAAVLQACAPDQNHYLSSKMGSDGAHTDILHIPAGGSAYPICQEVIDQKLHYLAMSGQEVFKLAVNTMASAALEALAHSPIDIDQVRWLVPHQANVRIINSVAKRLRLPEDRAYINLPKYGNTSAATIPIALDELVRNDLVKQDDYLLLVAFGAGLTWGASLIQW